MKQIKIHWHYSVNDCQEIVFFRSEDSNKILKFCKELIINLPENLPEIGFDGTIFFVT
jgi:hypothetical protein